MVVIPNRLQPVRNPYLRHTFLERVGSLGSAGPLADERSAYGRMTKLKGSGRRAISRFWCLRGRFGRGRLLP